MNRLARLSQPERMGRDRYKKLLRQWQLDLLSLQQSLVRDGARVIVNVEGMDAGGKGGAIRRMIRRLDPRSYKVYRIGKPDPRDQDRHYLYRFWSRVPAPGEIVIFDRSWYGRVLVERIEEFACNAEWKRAYQEINDFERTLVDDGVILLSLWFHIDPDVQLARFEKRLDDPFKAWKMSDEDWRNRARWDDYIVAAEDMFEQTDTPYAPWTLIPANDKRHARLLALRAVVTALSRAASERRVDSHPLRMPEF